MLVLDIQHSDSVYTYIFFFRFFFPYRSLQNTENISLCCTVGPIVCLLYTVVCIAIFHSSYGQVIFRSVYTTFSLFIHLHLGCFHVLAIINRCTYLFQLKFSSFPDISPGVGLPDHMVALFLVFKGFSLLFSIAAALIYIPT